LKIAVIGTGISGLSAAWLLAREHDVTIYEKDAHVGGHSNTVDVDLPDGRVAVDTGFIVYNPPSYPNLTQLFGQLGVATAETDMSFSISLDDGRYEYASNLRGLFAQPGNLANPDFWSMLSDIPRFFREARILADGDGNGNETLDEFMVRCGFGRPFIENHLLPMAAAIWSSPTATIRDYPARSFARFYHNHGLLSLWRRPQWRTVLGGSREYVRRLTGSFADRIRLNTAVERVHRLPGGVRIEDRQGGVDSFDHVVLATHADQALRLLADVSHSERRILGAFNYSRNVAILHNDTSLMPHRRAAWASWNYLSRQGADAEREVCCTYWMNNLQPLPTQTPLMVTLNPNTTPKDGSVLRSSIYHHPMLDAQAARMQPMLWQLQGHRRTWYCGSYFGHGFHEDGIQAGLAVAEALGGRDRPWSVPDGSDRIGVPPLWPQRTQPSIAA